jgi:Ribosomal_S17 N-terminal
VGSCAEALKRVFGPVLIEHSRVILAAHCPRSMAVPEVSCSHSTVVCSSTHSADSPHAVIPSHRFLFCPSVGSYIDHKCPFTGNVSIRGRILSGTVKSTKMNRTLIVRRNYLHFIKKYQRCATQLAYLVQKHHATLSCQ